MKQLEVDSFFCWGIRFATGEVEKELEKGKYDLAHLAYSIWPKRVIKVSYKDCNYAIAHDLEEDLWEEIE